jgi:hypothetical protein
LRPLTEVIEMKTAFNRANRLLEKIGFPPLEVGSRREADNFLHRYMSTRFTTPICSIRFEGKPIAVYAFDDHFYSRVYVIPFHCSALYMQPDYRTETGFALAWRALTEHLIWRREIFAVAAKFHSTPHSPTRAYTLEVVPDLTIGKFELIAFYDLEKDSFEIVFHFFDPAGERIWQKSTFNDFSAVEEYLLRPLALLSL